MDIAWSRAFYFLLKFFRNANKPSHVNIFVLFECYLFKQSILRY